MLNLYNSFLKVKSNKYIINISWLIIDRIIKLSIGIFVTVLMARILEPEQFGKYNYIIAVAFFLSPIANAGVASLVIKDLNYGEYKKDVILGSSFLLQLSLSFLSIFILFLYYIIFDNRVEILFAILLSTSFFFQTSNIIKYYFDSLVKAKYYVLVENVSFFITSLIRIAALFFFDTYQSFIVILIFESLLIFIGMIFLYQKQKNKIFDWHFDINLALRLLKKSLPFILSGFSIMLYMKTDIVIINNLLGSNSGGIYSVALKLSEVYYTIPLILMSTFAPTLNSEKKNSHDLFLIKLQKLMYIVILISFCIIFFTMFYADDLINILFGKNYQESAEVLKLHIWTGLFVFIGIISGQWFFLENLQWFVLLKTLTGAFINIVLNFILIPKYGINGAAIATLVSQFFSTFLLDLFYKKSRPIFFFNLLSLITLPKFLYQKLNYAINK